MSNIKVIYNWIGPKGPIPNTELPHILNLAAVGEYSQTNSTKFWCDSLWHLLFCNQPSYELGSTHMMDPRQVYLYPLQLVWRIGFDNYFYYTSGVLEFSHTPGHVIEMARHARTFIVLEHSAETNIERPHLKKLHEYFEAWGIPRNKVIYITGCMNCEQIYNEYCLEKGIVNPRDKLNLVSFPVSQNSLAIHLANPNVAVPEYDTEKVPEKLFLSLNRRFRDHRISLIVGLDKLNLLDRSYVSLETVDPENYAVTFESRYNPYYLKYLEVTDDDVAKTKSKLPLVLDEERDNVRMCQDFDNALRPLYQNSLVSVVTETNYDKFEVSLTEKSFKPAKEKHPFIIVGAPGSIRAMQEMGYKTFSEFWDESYDLANDPAERLQRIFLICKQISTWSDDQIRDFRRKVKPILEHNYEILKINYNTIVAKNIKELVTKIIQDDNL